MKFVIRENQEGWGWGYFLCGYMYTDVPLQWVDLFHLSNLIGS